MKIWTVAAQKGGVGKTTTVVSIAGSLVQDGARVLVVDLDPHGSLTSYFRLDPDTVEPSIYSVFEAVSDERALAVDGVVRSTAVPGIAILPSSAALVSLERRFGQRQGMGLVLQRALAQCAETFDYCIIDCPPTLGVLVINALVCCELLIAPVQTEFLAAQSLDRLMNTLRLVQNSRGVDLPHLVVPTMFDRRTRASQDTLAGLRGRHDFRLWDDIIPVDTQFREASRIGQPLPLLQPHARGSRAYAKLVDELLGHRAAAQLRVVG